MTPDTSARKRFAIAFGIAFVARALLVGIVTEVEGCSLEAYAGSADGQQILAVARGWRGDLESVRDQGFYKTLRASSGLASSHLIRFFPTAPGIVAAGKAFGLPVAVAATFPFWILMATAAGVIAVWARDLRIGLLVGLLPPISLYASSIPDGSGWLLLFAAVGLLGVQQRRLVVAGAAFGLAAWSRPEGLFPLVGMLVALAVCRRRREAVQIAAAAAGTISIGALITAVRFWPLFMEIRSAGRATEVTAPAFLDFPGHALLQAFQSPDTPAWKLFYVGAHLAVALSALWLLVIRARRTGADSEASELTALTVWLTLQLGLVLFLRGTQGFDDLPRYVGSAAPAIVVGFAPWIRRSRWSIAGLCLASLIIAVIPARQNVPPECRAPANGAAWPAVSENGRLEMWAGSMRNSRRFHPGNRVHPCFS